MERIFFLFITSGLIIAVSLAWEYYYSQDILHSLIILLIWLILEKGIFDIRSERSFKEERNNKWRVRKQRGLQILAVLVLIVSYFGDRIALICGL